MPAPVDGRGAPWLLDFLATHVRALRNVGALRVSLDRHGVPADGSLNVTVTDAHGHSVVEAVCSGDHISAEGTAGATGEHHVRVAGRQLPEHGAAFSIDITYLAPQII